MSADAIQSFQSLTCRVRGHFLSQSLLLSGEKNDLGDCLGRHTVSDQNLQELVGYHQSSPGSPI